ncbi:MAG TPA: hypothetical protein VFA22_04100, partial [Stellaceae bacterium]|nr:hypothetical protein [Stellaceae bacterium]
MKRALWIIGGAVAALLLVLALGFGLLQTRPGKAWLAARVGALLSDAQERVTIGGIAGIVPFDFRVRAVAIADDAGPRLTADEARIRISAADLLAGRLTITRLAIGHAAILRPGRSNAALDWRALLHPPLPVALDALEIGELRLGAAVLGTPLAAHVTGAGALGGGRASARLAAERVDGTPGALTLDAAFGGTPPRLRLEAHASEPTGALLSRLLDRPEPLPLSLALTGDGPLADWQGRLDAHAGSATLAASVRVAGSAPYRLSVTAEARPAPLLPPEIAPILGDRVTLAAEAGFAPDAITLGRLAVGAAGF